MSTTCKISYFNTHHDHFIHVHKSHGYDTVTALYPFTILYLFAFTINFEQNLTTWISFYDVVEGILSAHFFQYHEISTLLTYFVYI